MSRWVDYRKLRPRAGRRIAGTLRVFEGVGSLELDNRRDLLVWLPPSYRRGSRRYPVLYMQDGQNLFDPATSHAGDWQADLSLRALAGDGLEIIVVGIPHAGRGRLAEYTPFHDPWFGGGKGDLYLDFLVETVKPLVDRSFRTAPERERTGIMGSSLGGLISLYAAFSRPEVFGLAGVMSPSLGTGGEAIFPFVEHSERLAARVYLDVGTREALGKIPALADAASKRYADRVRRMRFLLERKLERPARNLLYVEEEGALHHEAAWARRFPPAVRFLFGQGGDAGAPASG